MNLGWFQQKKGGRGISITHLLNSYTYNNIHITYSGVTKHSIYLHSLGMKDYYNALPFQWNIKKKIKMQALFGVQHGYQLYNIRMKQ